MTDYSPLPPDPNRDPRTDDRPYATGSRRGLGILIGILVAIALVGGLLYFSGNRGASRIEQAQVPVDRTLPGPARTDQAPADRSAPALPPAGSPGAPAAPR